MLFTRYRDRCITRRSQRESTWAVSLMDSLFEALFAPLRRTLLKALARTLEIPLAFTASCQLIFFPVRAPQKGKKFF